VSLKLIKLSKFYKGNEGTPHVVEALKDVTLDINDGSCTIVYGPTGSGKTTLLSLMSGILTPTYGEIVLNNLHASRARDREITLFREKFIGYVPQEVLLIKDLTILENLLSPNLYGRVPRRMLRRGANELIERLNLTPKVHSKPHELSGGEKKKAMIARALLKNPRYLLADEPVSELDQDSANGIMKLFNEYRRRGTAVVMASHKKLQMRHGCDIYLMHKGQIMEYARGGRK
jgi:putative ABC transport system ATP-binding protein